MVTFGQKQGLDFLVVGLGMMGSITPHIIEQAGGRVTGFLGWNMEEVGNYLRNNRAPNLKEVGTFEDYDVALNSGIADAVLIAVPNFLHAEMGIKAAEAGKHILVEKPFASNAPDAEHFGNVVIGSGVAAEINSQYRHHELMGTLREMIDEGYVDEVEMGYLQGWQAKKDDAIGWRPEVAIAGRGKLVGDLGAHVLQMTSYLFGGHITSFKGQTYNVHPVRFKPKVATVSFDETERKGPDEDSDSWTEMDMFDSKKYSGDDRAAAQFELQDRNKRKVQGKYILSQVDPGDDIMGNENNFYIRVKMRGGSEIRWSQEDPNHLDVLKQGEIYERIERSSAPSLTGRPGGHPHGYGDSILLEVDRMMDVATSRDDSRIRAYTHENISQAVEAVRKIDTWLSTPLKPYNGELDDQLKEARSLRLLV